MSKTGPLRVCSFESRRADEMRSLIERHGGVATVAPSMREVPLEENAAAFEFGEALTGGRIDVVIFMTGVGARTLFETLQTRYDRGDLVKALNECRTVVRGPKPTAVLKEWKIQIGVRAPEPNTWREVLDAIDAAFPVEGMSVAVQEYGEPNSEFYEALNERGANVTRVPVYRWALPEDTGPLREAVRATIAGAFDVLLFTSAQQVENVLSVAGSEGVRDEWLAATRRCVVASIGPTCTEKLLAEGLAVDLEPSHPKMAHLVREALREAAEMLRTKRV